MTVLSTINHTTVEALGFKLISSKDGFDIFKLKNITVSFDKFGNFHVSVNNKLSDINKLADLVELAK